METKYKQFTKSQNVEVRVLAKKAFQELLVKLRKYEEVNVSKTGVGYEVTVTETNKKEILVLKAMIGSNSYMIRIDVNFFSSKIPHKK
jgi:hypothetical protein